VVQNACVCYAYLEDCDASSPQSQLHLASGLKETGLYVSAMDPNTKSSTWLTLRIEELIAPAVVEFYDSKWVKLGTKDNLCQQICKIPGIDPCVLRGANPTKLIVAERMTWASERLTSRVEDTAYRYSLMGLFNVFMPMLYGEGNRAFVRLQEEILRRPEDYTIFA
jgi:hypothetical protein